MDDKGLALAFGGVAAVFVYGGITGRSPLLAIKSIIQGNKPSGTAPQYPISGSTGTATALTGSGSSGALPPAASSPGTVTGNRALGKMLAAGYGWSSGNEWNSLDDLWNRESGWDNTVWNGESHADTLPAGSSGAYGIAQSLPYSKYPKAGWPPGYGGSANATAQITWGLEYIKATYGSPSAAWEHETAEGWY